MTWSYFTAYLDGSRPIAKVERDELYDKLQEVLTTAGCSGAGYSLNSTDQTAIKGSNLLTDRASLNGPGATNTKGRLQTILATASSAFSNYSTAVSNALSAEGITSGNRDDIIASNLDDRRLWNYYRRVINGLLCCTLPSITSDSTASGCLGVSFSYTITASETPTSYDATGLPAGLSINTGTGEISGTPTELFSGYATISATNACGTRTGALHITIGGDCAFSGTYSTNSPIPEEIDDTFDVTGQFDTGCPTAVTMTWNLGTGGAAITVNANGTPLYVGSCLTGDGSLDFDIPDGTTSLQVVAVCGCADTATSVAITIECAVP